MREPSVRTVCREERLSKITYQSDNEVCETERLSAGQATCILQFRIPKASQDFDYFTQRTIEAGKGG